MVIRKISDLSPGDNFRFMGESGVVPRTWCKLKEITGTTLSYFNNDLPGIGLLDGPILDLEVYVHTDKLRCGLCDKEAEITTPCERTKNAMCAIFLLQAAEDKIIYKMKSPLNKLT